MMKPALNRSRYSVVEHLENRQLLSAVPTLAVSRAYLAFNSAIAGTTNAGPSHIETVTISDEGSGTLIFDSGAFTIIGNPNAANSTPSAFSIVNASSLPTNLAPGQSATIQLRYTATIAGTQAAILRIGSNDPTTPEYQVALNGVGTRGQFGYNEPSLVQVLRANGIPTIVGAGPNDINASTVTYPSNPDPSSQEVPMQRMVPAGPGPVSITTLASFDTNTSPAVYLGYYSSGNPSALNELFSVRSSDAQTMYPVAQGATTFDPGSAPFSLYGQFPGTTIPGGGLDTHYSEDVLNTLDPTHSRKFRFFPLENPAGGVIPNSYVFAVEDYNNPTYNSFVNFVGIISNVKAAPNAASGSTPASPTGNNAAVMDVRANGTAPGSTTLVFNTIKTTNPIVADVVHNTNTVTIFNAGDQPLLINSLTLSDTKNWMLVNPPAAGTSIAGGSSLTVTVKFIATTVPPHSNNQTNDVASGTLVSVQQAGGVWSGTLTINSSDTVNPTRTLNLAGYWQIESEHENEPGLPTITNLLFGYSTNDTGSAGTQGTELPNNGNTPVTYGSEVDPSTNQGLLVAAIPGGAVTVTELAAFHQQYQTTTASNGTNTYGVRSATESGNVVTITTAGSTVLKVGQQVTISGVAIPDYNGTFTITSVPSANSFTYTNTVSGLAEADTPPTSPQTGWYASGSSSSKFIFRDQPNNGQSVLPLSAPDSYSTVQTSFTPTGAFGLNLDGEKSQDSLNYAADAPFNTSGHAVRFFPLIDASGNPVPNTWLVGMDYRNYSDPNSDYQDLVEVVSNATFQSMPATPYDLRATDGTSGASLQWAPVNGAVGYNVYQLVNGSQVRVNSSLVTTPSYFDSSAPASTLIHYQVTAVNASSVESLPAATSVTLTAVTMAPGTPTIQKADGSSGSEVVLSWDPVSGATSYTLERQGPGDASFTPIATGLTTNNYSDTSVTAGATYKYVLQAQNSSGSSGLSAPATAAVATPSTPPGAPVIQQADGSSGTEVTLAWGAVSGATTYVVERQDPGQSSFSAIASGLTGTSFFDTSVTPGASYQYEVLAQNSFGNSPLSAPATATVSSTPATLPTPSNVHVASSTPSDVLVAWNATPGATTYSVARASAGSSTFTQIASGLTSTSFDDANVSAGATYQYTVQAQNSSGFSGNSLAISATVPLSGGGSDVTVGKGAARFVQFAAANGATTIIRMTGAGIATVHFAGSSIVQNTVRGAVIVNGDSLSVAGISITGSNAASGLSIVTRGSGTVSVGGISTDGSLNNITARSALLHGALTVAGSVGRIQLGAIDTATISVGGALKSFRVNSFTNSNINAVGSIRTIQALAWNSPGAVSAPSIFSIAINGDATLNVNTGVLHALRVRGTLSGSTLNFTAPGQLDLANLSAGAISNTALTAAGNLGSISARTLTNSQIDAGVAAGVAFPASASDFSSNAFINSVLLRKLPGSFSDVNSTIAAGLLKRVSLGHVQYNNSGTPFGVAAHGINSLTLDNPTTGRSTTLTHLLTQDIVTADLAAKGISPQDFAIRIL